MLYTFVIPAFNSQHSLRFALDSVLNQTFQEFEAIVIDDCSIDSTYEILKAYSDHDSRIRVFRNEINSGAPYTRNRCISLASGDCISILDSDDFLAPDFLSSRNSLAETDKWDMIADNQLFIREGAKYPYATLVKSNDFILNRQISAFEFVERNMPLSKGVSLGYAHPIIRRDFLKMHNIRYAEGCKTNHDFVFYLTCLLYGARFMISEHSCYYYSVSQKSLSANKSSVMIEENLLFNHKFLEHPLVINDSKLSNVLKKRAMRFITFYRLRLASEQFKKGKYLEGINVLRKDFRTLLFALLYVLRKFSLRSLKT